ncbi:MAG TPA: sigma-70 family RNA polymerase sigma factor [Capillimicrobium sp.]|nr:sigma-70 family RNA polymerase sigma factor [Capillimicrobium sp.]
MEPGSLTHPVRLAGRSLLRLQSDARLTELARAGHEPAFAAIVDRYRPALLGYCTRILGPERAEDAVQQALASAHQAMTSGDDRPLRLRPWLYRIAHNTALNVLRARRDEAELSDAALASGGAPDETLAQRERLEEILAAIATLPPAQRDALLLRELEGRSHEEIADALGVSSGAARAVIFRARAAVRAACTALTPSPLLMRLAEVAGTSGGEHASGTVAKAAAGVLAACAVVGGATGGIVERRGADRPVAHAQSGRDDGGERAADPGAPPPQEEPVARAAATGAAASAPPGRAARQRDRDRDRGPQRTGRRVVAVAGVGALADRHDRERDVRTAEPDDRRDGDRRHGGTVAPPPQAAAPERDGRRDRHRGRDHEQDAGGEPARPERSRPDRGRPGGAAPPAPGAEDVDRDDRGHPDEDADARDDRGQGRLHGGPGRRGGPPPGAAAAPDDGDEDYPTGGVSGRRANAASMSASENSGSSSEPDR